MTLTLDATPDADPVMAHHNAFGAVAAGILTSVLGVAGVGVGLAGMLGPPRSVQIGWLVPLIGVALQLDPLGGFFIALTGAVAVPVGVYAIGYARREHLGAVPLSVLPLFAAAMMLVPAAASVSTFLLAWELMAAASLILVAAQHARPAVRQAAEFLAADIEKISGYRPAVAKTPGDGVNIWLVTLGHGQLPAAIDARAMQGQWESYRIATRWY